MHTKWVTHSGGTRQPEMLEKKKKISRTRNEDTAARKRASDETNVHSSTERQKIDKLSFLFFPFLLLLSLFSLVCMSMCVQHDRTRQIQALLTNRMRTRYSHVLTLNVMCCVRLLYSLYISSKLTVLHSLFRLLFSVSSAHLPWLSNRTLKDPLFLCMIWKEELIWERAEDRKSARKVMFVVTGEGFVLLGYKKI